MPAIDPSRAQPVILINPEGLELGDPLSPISTIDPALALRIEPNAAGSPVYMGKAVPGSPTGAPVWQIRAFVYDASNNLLSSGYANGDPAYVYVWDSRGSYTYS